MYQAIRTPVARASVDQDTRRSRTPGPVCHCEDPALLALSAGDDAIPTAPRDRFARARSDGVRCSWRWGGAGRGAARYRSRTLSAERSNCRGSVRAYPKDPDPIAGATSDSSHLQSAAGGLAMEDRRGAEPEAVLARLSDRLWLSRMGSRTAPRLNADLRWPSTDCSTLRTSTACRRSS